MKPAATSAFRDACQKANRAFSEDQSTDGSDHIDKREAFYLSIVDRLGLLKPGIKAVDLGAGFSRFSPVLSQL